MGNAEENPDIKEIEQVFIKLQNKSYINDCTKAKHLRHIISGMN